MQLGSTTKVKMKQKFTSLTKIHMSPLYRGTKLWDILPTILQKEKKTIWPIFHCDAKLLALGTFASPNAKDSTFASPDARIPTCWYLLR